MPKDTIELVADVKALVESMKSDSDKVMASLKEANAATQGKADTATADAAKAVKVAEETAATLIATGAQLLEVQQQIAKGVKAGTVAPKTLGELITSSEEFTAFAQGTSSKFRIEANTIIGQEGSPPANSPTLVPRDRLDGIVPGAYRALKISDLLPQGNTTSSIIEFARELAFTNRAAEVAEGDTKPQTDITFELVTTPVRTIAHWLKASKILLDDAPALQSYIDGRLRYGVELRADAQLLNGNGVGQNLAGITKSGNYTAFNASTAGEISLDSLNRMIEQVEDADYAPTGIIMHTTDWHIIERQKVGGTSNPNQYVVGDPLGVINRVIWGLPVAVTNQATPGYAIVGAFNIAFQVFNRMSTVVEMFEQDDVNVQKNLLTIRAEKRLALAAYRPASVVRGILVNGSSH